MTVKRIYNEGGNDPADLLSEIKRANLGCEVQ
jgi:hypothetical protein